MEQINNFDELSTIEKLTNTEKYSIFDDENNKINKVEIPNLIHFLNIIFSDIKDPLEIMQTKLTLFQTRLDIELDNIDIKINPKGLGVFAKNDILSGSLITLYPVDFYNNNKINPFPKHIYKIDKNTIISGDPNNITSTYAGHICNDGALFHGGENIRDGEEELYNKISNLKKNADIYIIEDSIIVIVASKNIKKDDEILLNYGTGRWRLMEFN